MITAIFIDGHARGVVTHIEPEPDGTAPGQLSMTIGEDGGAGDGAAVTYRRLAYQGVSMGQHTWTYGVTPSTG